MDIHTILINLINQLLTLKDSVTDEAQINDLNNLKRILFTLLDQVVEQDLDKQSGAYNNALGALKDAKNAADAAIQDINKVADAINMAAKAAKAVDNVVQLFAKYLK